MPLPITFYGATVADNTVKPNGQPETSSWQLAITTATPATVAAIEGDAGALLAAIAAICIGSNQNSQLVYNRQFLSASPAASQLAQRENKWLARYHDATNYKKYTVSWPCADLTELVSGQEFLVLTGGAGATLKAAFEAIVVSPDDSTHSVVLDSVQFVGRST